MLNRAEKSYWMALDAIKRKEYQAAVAHFDTAAHHFRNDAEFSLFYETTRLLVSIGEELKTASVADDEIVKKESF